MRLYFPIDLTGNLNQLEVGGVYLEHTTLRILSKRLRAKDILCYLIIISSQFAFINTSLIKQTKNIIVC